MCSPAAVISACSLSDKGLHVSLLSAEQGVVLDGDPYTLEDFRLQVAGVALPVAAKGQGLYEMEPEHRLDYVEWFQTPRTLGYLGRLRGWEERTGITVVPYDRRG